MDILLVSSPLLPPIWITQLGFHTSSVHRSFNDSTYHRDDQVVGAHPSPRKLLELLSLPTASDLFAQNGKGEALDFLVGVPPLIHVRQLPI